MKNREILTWARDAGFVFDFIGDQEDCFEGFSSLSNYKENTITWVKKINTPIVGEEKRIRCAVVQAGVEFNALNKLISTNSKELFFAILTHFFSSTESKAYNKGNTFIGEGVILGENVRIGINCVLDGEITIGNNTIIEHNVVISNTVKIGDNCIIHSGTVIGKDGFGFSFDSNNTPVKVPHFGGVIIGNRVEIGANCTVDRGTIDSTIIGDDTKVDNLVLIAHNTIIGSGVLIVGCTDIAGSSKIGNKSYIGPQVCIKNQSSIGENSFVGMGVMVNEHIGDNMMIVNQNITRISKNRNYRRFL